MASLSNINQIPNTINLANPAVLKVFCTHNNINTVDAVEEPTNEQTMSQQVVEANVYEFEEEDLVEYVKQYLIIWNTRDKNYKDTGKKSIVWGNIQSNKELNSSGKLSIFY